MIPAEFSLVLVIYTKQFSIHSEFKEKEGPKQTYNSIYYAIGYLKIP